LAALAVRPGKEDVFGTNKVFRIFRETGCFSIHPP